MPEAAAGLDFVFQWVLTGEDAATFHVVIRESRLTFGDGAHEAPTCTMSMSAADFVQVVNGELSGATVMTTGRGTIAGDIMKAMKMQAILAGTKK